MSQGSIDMGLDKHQFLITQLQKQLEAKDQEIQYFRTQQQINLKSPPILTSSMPVHSEENVLDDLDDYATYAEETRSPYQH